MEKELIKEYNSLHPYGYNLRTGGYNTEDSDLTKKRKSESRIGKKHNEITKYKISNNQIGNRRDTKERNIFQSCLIATLLEIKFFITSQAIHFIKEIEPMI